MAKEHPIHFQKAYKMMRAEIVEKAKGYETSMLDAYRENNIEAATAYGLRADELRLMLDLHDVILDEVKSSLGR